MLKWFVLSALIICGVQAPLAQAQIMIKGRVVTLSGEGIPGASVVETTICTSPFPSTVTCSGSAVTDDSGYYEFSVPFCPPGSSCLNRQYSLTVFKPGYAFSAPILRATPGMGLIVRDHVGLSEPLLVSASAASYAPRLLAAGMITASFGADLAARTEAATTLPLPTVLAGRSVLVIDAFGAERLASLLFVSPTQINYIVPDGVLNPVVVKVLEGARALRGGFVSPALVAPGVFTANADGEGVAAAVVLRVKPDGTQIYEPVARFDPAQNKYVFAPIDFGPADDQLILVPFGTGWRNRASVLPSLDVTVSLNGTDAPVEYASLQPTIPGLDQINARLPRSLAGSGELWVSLSVGGGFANRVKLSFK